MLKSDEQNRLLTKAKLQISSDLQEGVTRQGCCILKEAATRTYLVVSNEQRSIIMRFLSPRTVPEVLFELIFERRCPSLREYYELILKACLAGLMREPDWPEPALVRGTNWRLRMNASITAFLAVSGLLLALFFIPLIPAPVLPGDILTVLSGIALVSAIFSLGYLMAACTLAGGDCVVYHPGFQWLSFAPHFRVDLDDVIMGGPRLEIAVGLARLAPVFFAVFFCAMWAPGLTFFVLLAALYLVSPLPSGPLVRIIRASCHTPLLSVGGNLVFEANRTLTRTLAAWWHYADRRYLLISSAHLLVWAVLVTAGTSWFVYHNAIDLFVKLYTSPAPYYISWVMLCLTVLIAATAFYVGMWHFFHKLTDLFAPPRRRPMMFQKIEGPGTPAVAELLQHTLLFRELSAPDRELVAAAMQPIAVAPRTYVIRESDPGDKLYLILEGRVEVLKNLSDGRSMTCAILGPGEVFGEIALLQNVPRTRSVRTQTHCRLLVLLKEDFDRLLVTKLGADQVSEILQKIAFLNRIALCSNWSTDQLMDFASHATIRTYPRGHVLIQEGRQNNFFYILYDGVVDIRQNGRWVARLEPGDCFGEISLIESGITTASVETLEPSRCLVISKIDFLRFITEDFRIILQFDDLGSKRLHRPLFPIK